MQETDAETKNRWDFGGNHSLTLKPPLHLTGEATRDSGAPLVGGQLVANRMVHSISAAQCLSSGWCFSCTSSAHFRPKWDACWSWFLLKTENHYLHQQKLDANRKSKEFHQKTKATSLPLIKLRNGFVAFQSCIPEFSSKSRRSCCPWRCPFSETEVAYWDSTRRTGEPFLVATMLVWSKECWFYAWWSLFDPNCCREISGREGCLK